MPDEYGEVRKAALVEKLAIRLQYVMQRLDPDLDDGLWSDLPDNERCYYAFIVRDLLREEKRLTGHN